MPSLTATERARSQGSRPFQLADSVIDGLSLLNDAQKRLADTDVRGNAAGDPLESVSHFRLAMGNVERARQVVEPFRGNDHHLVAVGAEHFSVVCHAVLVSMAGAVETLEQFLNGPPEQRDTRLETLVSETSKWIAKSDEAWRALPDAVASVSDALIDADRPQHGGVRYLSITSEETAALSAKLTGLFGASVTRGIQGHMPAADLSARLFWEFLNEPGRVQTSPSDPPDRR